MTNKSDKSQVNIRMSSSLIAALKQQADYEGISLTELITRQAQSYLNLNEEVPQPFSGSNLAHPDSFLPASATRDSLNFAQRLTTLERLLAAGLDNIAIVNRLGTLECQLADSICQLEKRLVALEGSIHSDGVKEPSDTATDGTTTDYQALLSRITAIEIHLAQIELKQQQPPPPEEPDLDDLSRKLAPLVAGMLAQQLTPISQVEQAPTTLAETNTQQLSSVLASSSPITEMINLTTDETITQESQTDQEVETATSIQDDAQTQGDEDTEMSLQNAPHESSEELPNHVSPLSFSSSLPEAASPNDTSFWIYGEEAFKYAQLQGYRKTQGAFRMKAPSKKAASKVAFEASRAFYARYKLDIDLERRGGSGQKTKWFRPTDPDHYRRLMGRFSGGTDKA